MAARPPHLDLGARARGPSRTATPSPRDVPSPRSGDIPPALSPLDAFALQSRLLARKLEESQQNGNRLSRLPPLTIANELAKVRTGYSNPLSPYSASSDEQTPLSAEGGDRPAIAEPEVRPRSLRPAIQPVNAGNTEGVDGTDSLAQLQPANAGNTEGTDGTESLAQRWQDLRAGAQGLLSRDSFWGSQPARTGSPEQYARIRVPQVDEADGLPLRTSHPGFQITTTQLAPTGLHKRPTSDSMRSNESTGLAPPRSPALSRQSNRTPSVRSARMDSGDDSDAHSRERKPSGGGAWSRPRSPFSPVFAPRRSPSPTASSDFSGGLRSPPLAANFSRPLSRASQAMGTRPSFESTTRQSNESPYLRPSTDAPSLHESLGSPSFAAVDSSEDLPAGFGVDQQSHGPSGLEHASLAAPSYIYAKYSLPRGRVLSRESMVLPDFSTHVFEWGQPTVQSNVEAAHAEHDTSGSIAAAAPNPTKPSAEQVSQQTYAPPDPSRFELRGRSQSADDVRPSPPKAPAAATGSPLVPSTASTERPRSSTPTRASRPTNGTPREPKKSRLASTAPGDAASDPLTPEQHLAKGVACHQDGSFRESTYHLRIAARGGNPTGMLLYALACRHGWGMRPAPAEGVTWLRKAVDTAGLEVAFDEDTTATTATTATATTTTATVGDFAARTAHKAQFALSIYELGVSYMNGWGIGQDRSLALRCFEVAGSWGDGDALAEAGFCYAKGVGCKKDLYKAADFYRRAEKRGVEMAGNSWIYKDKYMPRPAAAAPAAAAAATDTWTAAAARPSQDVNAESPRKFSRDKGRNRDRDRDRDKDAADKAKRPRFFGARKKSTSADVAGGAVLGGD